jgi:hypothetical protein
MQPSPHGKALDSGYKNPKNALHVYIAAGVFSETWNYIEAAKIRPELFLSG